MYCMKVCYYPTDVDKKNSPRKSSSPFEFFIYRFHRLVCFMVCNKLKQALVFYSVFTHFIDINDIYVKVLGMNNANVAIGTSIKMLFWCN